MTKKVVAVTLSLVAALLLRRFCACTDAPYAHFRCISRLAPVLDVFCMCSVCVSHAFWHVYIWQKRAWQLIKACCSSIAIAQMSLVHVLDASCMHFRCILHAFRTCLMHVLDVPQSCSGCILHTLWAHANITFEAELYRIMGLCNLCDMST